MSAVSVRGFGLERVVADFRGDEFRDLKVLVTGGAGFLGSWVAESLLALSAEVAVLDNFAGGLRVNVDHMLGNPRFRLIEADVSTWEPVGHFDYVVHAASRASPEEYQAHPVETLYANSVGTLRILEYARRSGCRLLYTSTSEVYGDAEVIPTPETYWGRVNPVGVRSCYDEAKRFAEAAIAAYVRQYGVDAVIVRIFNTYGPRIRGDGYYGRVIPRFIAQALRGEPVTVNGDGSQTRSFTYVSDTVRGLLRALASANARGQYLNIGNTVETTILEVAKLVLKVTDSNSKIVFQELPQDDPKRRCADISLAKRVLSWAPEVTLETGLKQTLKWLQKGSKASP